MYSYALIVILVCASADRECLFGPQCAVLQELSTACVTAACAVQCSLLPPHVMSGTCCNVICMMQLPTAECECFLPVPVKKLGKVNNSLCYSYAC